MPANAPLSLETLSVQEDCALYRLPVHDDDPDVMIASTPYTRRVLTIPEITGVTFQDDLSTALGRALKALLSIPDLPLSNALSSNPVDVLYILRGGLNFDLHRHLTKILHASPEVTFLSSQRVLAGGGFTISETSYVKPSLQDASVLCVGDISATGTTIRHALIELLTRYISENKEPRWLMLISIGTQELINTITGELKSQMRRLAPNLAGISVLFLEAIFYLYDGASGKVPGHLMYTDFFRKNFPRTLEFEFASIRCPASFLERCAIYDGGSRAFEPKTYLQGLIKYWNQLRNNTDISVRELLAVKSDLLQYELDFDRWSEIRPWWNEIATDIQLHELYSLGTEALKELEHTPLANICNERLQAIEEKIAEK